MKKIDLNIIPSVNTSDIIRFIQLNSKHSWNECNDIFSKELDYITYELPDEIKMINEYIISKVIIDKLEYNGWIKKFTEVQEIKQDYYIIFTD